MNWRTLLSKALDQAWNHSQEGVDPWNKPFFQGLKALIEGQEPTDGMLSALLSWFGAIQYGQLPAVPMKEGDLEEIFDIPDTVLYWRYLGDVSLFELKGHATWLSRRKIDNKYEYCVEQSNWLADRLSNNKCSTDEIAPLPDEPFSQILEKRLADIQEGGVEGIPAEQVIQDLREKLRLDRMISLLLME